MALISPTDLSISLDDVRAARLRIAPHVHRHAGPHPPSRQLDDARLPDLLKPRFPARRAFKARGAFSR